MQRYNADSIRQTAPQAVQKQYSVRVDYTSGTPQERILRVLMGAAERGESTPSNDSIIAMTQTAAKNITDYLHRLEDRGLIRVERRHTARRVTILATGKSTSWSGRKYRAFE